LNSLGTIRTGGIAGTAFVVLLVVFGFATPPPPMIDDPASEYLEYLQDNRTMLMVQASLCILLSFPLFLFLGPLRDKIASFPLGEPLAGMAVLAFAAGWAAASAVQMALGGLAFLSDTDLDASLARNLFLLLNTAYTGPIVLFGVTALFSGLPFSRASSNIRFLGWAGILVAVVEVIVSFSWGSSGLLVPGQGMFLGYLVLMAYLLAVSIAMIRTK